MFRSRVTRCERRALLAVAAACRWSWLLLSRLLSVQLGLYEGKLTRTAGVSRLQWTETRVYFRLSGSSPYYRELDTGQLEGRVPWLKQ
jgi:hypothetical protein